MNPMPIYSCQNAINISWHADESQKCIRSKNKLKLKKNNSWRGSLPKLFNSKHE